MLTLLLLIITAPLLAQVRWDGEAGDGQWTTAANWAGDLLPSAGDQVLLDNSIVPTSYTVTLPSGLAGVTLGSIVITPQTGNNIQLILPSTNTAMPALTVSGSPYGITLNDGAVFINASGSASMASLLVNDSLRINNGGQYIHRTRSSHAAMVSLLSRQTGTAYGLFTFDVPGGGYTIASTGRTFGTLVLAADASGGDQAYTTTAASPLTIAGDLVIKTGVRINFNFSSKASTTIKGNYIQEGGVCNLASQSNNSTMYIQGDCLQTGGIITETADGLPAVEFNGSRRQDLQLTGLTNQVAIRFNNREGINLLSDLFLPYDLWLVSGTVYARTFVITVSATARLMADSLPNENFIEGALRKEGLAGEAHFLFPVGKDHTKRWLALKQVTGNYTVAFVKSNPVLLASKPVTNLHHTSAIEYWTLQADAAPLPETAVELSFDNVNSGGVTDMATLRVAQLLGGSWTDQGNILTTGSPGSAGSVVSNIIAQLNTPSFFTLASSSGFQNPLPIQLLSFTAISKTDEVTLQWTISPEWAPLFFELQRSADDRNYETVSRVHLPQQALQYVFNDKHPLSGRQYYRLRIVAIDGAVSYSNSIAVVNRSAPAGIKAYRSLNSQMLSLSLEAAAGMANIQIFDMQGRLVWQRPLSMQTGRNVCSLDIAKLPAGIYVLLITQPGQQNQTVMWTKN